MMLIYKKSLNIDKHKNLIPMEQAEIIANKITLEDKILIENILSKIGKDARGKYNYNRSNATELLPFFQKYVDPNVKGNIFGCGGCVSKMFNMMFSIKRFWQNQTT